MPMGMSILKTINLRAKSNFQFFNLSEDSEDSEEALLMREFEKIKQEREVENRKRQEEEKESLLEKQ